MSTHTQLASVRHRGRRRGPHGGAARGLLPVLGLLSAAGIFLAAGPAQASVTGPAGHPAAVGPGAQLAAHGRKSATFGGYILQGGGPSRASATFVVPKLRCGRTRRIITASVGLQGASTYWVASLLIGCYGGKPHFWPSLVRNGKTIDFSGARARPGDVVTLIAHSSRQRGRTYVEVADRTRKFTRKVTGTFRQSNFPWIGDNGWYINDRLLGVPEFRSFRYQKCSADGSAMSTRFGWIGYDRVNAHGTVQISAGRIRSAGFSTAFRHS